MQLEGALAVKASCWYVRGYSVGERQSAQSKAVGAEDEPRGEGVL